MNFDDFRTVLADESDIHLGEDPSYIDVCDAIFQALNMFPNEIANNSWNFSAIGHTSMSCGDYVVFKAPMDLYANERAFICAPAGWKEIENFQQFQQKRDRVAQAVRDASIDTLMAMYEQFSAKDGEFDFYSILNQFKDKRCENQCPHCKSEDITWGDKDYTGSTIFQNATCNECKTKFTEEFTYTRTSVDEETEAELNNG